MPAERQLHPLRIKKAPRTRWNHRWLLIGPHQGKVASFYQIVVDSEVSLVRDFPHGVRQVPVEAGHKPETVFCWKRIQSTRRRVGKITSCFPAQPVAAFENVNLEMALA